MCPYGKPGDLLWVRESFARVWPLDEYERPSSDLGTYYRADPFPFNAWRDPETEGLRDEPRWTPSIHMPKWASRLTLEITDVRVERLQSISEEDARAEGCVYVERPSLSVGYHPAFRELWESINGAGSWERNDWLWVIGFKTHKENVDALLAERRAS